MIDKFEYGPTNRIRTMYTVSNPTDSPITIMAKWTCATVTHDELWRDTTTNELTNWYENQVKALGSAPSSSPQRADVDTQGCAAAEALFVKPI